MSRGKKGKKLGERGKTKLPFFVWGRGEEVIGKEILNHPQQKKKDGKEEDGQTTPALLVRKKKKGKPPLLPAVLHSLEKGEKGGGRDSSVRSCLPPAEKKGDANRGRESGTQGTGKECTKKES